MVIIHYYISRVKVQNHAECSHFELCMSSYSLVNLTNKQFNLVTHCTRLLFQTILFRKIVINFPLN